ncbi:hypothetical protein BN1708_005881 [Verticillium longisporum]|uniref:Uncharacterized protein n=1 Tax=Verticillium longisporum TaxID=100787 RepID=A0A0G4MF07_VERLO|nr:hypothetical protein BN1708_005881 [Verticillium longisporum]
MADRGSHRGGGGGGGGRGGGYRGRGGGGGGGRGGHGGGQGGAGGDRERPKKENILDLGKYMDKKITVKFNGGREESPPGAGPALQEVAESATDLLLQLLIADDKDRLLVTAGEAYLFIRAGVQFVKGANDMP